MSEFANPVMHKILIPLKSIAKLNLKFILKIFAILFLIIGLANPQVGTKIEEVKQVGIDVFILLDVSLSMKAEDIKPNRLEKAKHDIARLIQKLKGDRIGLIVFSGDAYVQFPLTTDYAAANLFLSAVDVTTVPQPGTSIAKAIKMAIQSFKAKEATQKAIIVITDGEDHEGETEAIAKKAADMGIRIYSIGLGSPAGAPIPLYSNSGKRIGFKKDKRGEPVLTKLDEAILQKIASATNGKYYRGSTTQDELNLIYSDLSKIEQTEFGVKKITDYEDRFYYFIAVTFLLLIVESFISSNKSKLLSKFEKAN